MLPVASPTTQNDNCPVCQHHFQPGDQVVRLRCSHLFDSKCIDPLLRCLACRTSFEGKKVEHINPTTTDPKAIAADNGLHLFQAALTQLPRIIRAQTAHLEENKRIVSLIFHKIILHIFLERRLHPEEADQLSIPELINVLKGRLTYLIGPERDASIKLTDGQVEYLKFFLEELSETNPTIFNLRKEEDIAFLKHHIQNSANQDLFFYFHGKLTNHQKGRLITLLSDPIYREYHPAIWRIIQQALDPIRINILLVQLIGAFFFYQLNKQLTR